MPQLDVLDDCVPARVMQEPFGCFRACVASYLGISYDEADGPTPTDYGQNHHYRGWQRWARARGLVIRHSADEDQIANLIGQGVLWIAYIYQQAIPGIAGEAHHCVLVRGDRIVHDPDPVQPQPPALEGRTLSELPELGWDLFDATVIVWGADEDPGDEPAPRPRHGLARAPFVTDPTASTFAAASSFDTESGAITGDALTTGGNWTVVTNSDTDDLSAAGGLATRTAVSDTGTIYGAGRAVTAGSTNYTALAVTLDVKVSTAATGGVYGIIARAVDSANFLWAALAPSPGNLELFRVVAGAGTLVQVPLTIAANTFYTLRLTINAAGQYAFQVFSQGGTTLLAQTSGLSSTLATGGALASGRVGIYDSNESALACTRTYDNFGAWVPDPDAAIFSGKTLEFRFDDTLRQDSTGTYYGRPQIARGPGVALPQAGSENKVVRIVAKAARNDITQAPRDNIADSLKLEVRGTSRHLVTPR